MEELDFLYEACLTALSSNRFVKFAAVLDNNGKLIVGKYRKGIQNYWPTDLIFDSHYHHHGSSYSFHLNYLIPAIKKREFSSPCSEEKEEQQEEEIHFGIIVINENVRLAIAQLNERKDKYLCIYVESSAPNQEIISQLSNAVI